jgi:hypothetical protein
MSEYINFEIDKKENTLENYLIYDRLIKRGCPGLIDLRLFASKQP